MSYKKHIKDTFATTSERIRPGENSFNYDQKKALFSFEHYDPSHQCISDWEKDEAKSFLSMLQKASQRTWYQIKQTGGDKKIGLGFTVEQIDPFTRPVCMTPDLRMSHMRANEKRRVFGFLKEGIWYVLRLDRVHKTHRD